MNPALSNATLCRRADWASRLAATLRAAQSGEFAWGRHDCALFAADSVLAITGVDLGASFRGRYKSARGAARAVRRVGAVDTLDALVTSLLGAPVPPARARRGDIVSFTQGSDVTLGVCNGVAALFLRRGGGLARVPTLRCDQAWRVG